MRQKCREACREDFINQLTHIHKRERSCSCGLCSGGATIRHECARPCDGIVAAHEERTYDALIRTSGSTYGCKPSTKCETSPAGFPTRSVCGWLDSTVALHWIRGNGKYKQFVRNRVRKIREKEINWRHVPTKENPADMGSRGGDVGRLTAFDELLEKHELWRVLRVGAWIGRLLHNIGTVLKQRVIVPFITEETDNVLDQASSTTSKFEPEI